MKNNIFIIAFIFTLFFGGCKNGADSKNTSLNTPLAFGQSIFHFLQKGQFEKLDKTYLTKKEFSKLIPKSSNPNPPIFFTG